ncbi:hypothetical protein [Mycobacterium sherrisii]|uniref:Mammalian cell entry protein n=1 Tax=Mycobacterium sherrisii TaxID=243061 RepID=A0A1E3SUH5_9MYCO|nr:hypothetical protein [Mycobacterium sherrisii]MCV7032308.1 hypothetical protein [Mycobacterium sherrisii]ODR05158.1 hypothetical protein BHQ21_15400 [Mycobacterium sherrisii]
MAENADAANRQLNVATTAAGTALAEDGDRDRDRASGRDDDGDAEQVSDSSDDAVSADDLEDGRSAKRPRNVMRLAATVGVVMIAATGGLGAWLITQAVKTDHQLERRALFLSVARQGALNLTTIKAAEIDADVQRILDSSTGVFHDDFQKRSQPFVGLVKQTQASSEGTVTEAGVESMTDETAQVLVAVSVKTTTPGAPPDQQPRLWRMRLHVQQVGGSAKVSDVVFVP